MSDINSIKDFRECIMRAYFSHVLRILLSLHYTLSMTTETAQNSGCSRGTSINSLAIGGVQAEYMKRYLLVGHYGGSASVREKASLRFHCRVVQFVFFRTWAVTYEASAHIAQSDHHNHYQYVFAVIAIIVTLLP